VRESDTVDYVIYSYKKEGDTPNLPLRDAILNKVVRRIDILNSYCYGGVMDLL